MKSKETNATKRAVPCLRDAVAMAHAADVANSLEFYGKLGFTVANTYEVEGRLQ